MGRRNTLLYSENITKGHVVVKIANPNKWVYKHRWIMLMLLERSLTVNELVHHKDGNGLNNAINNLQLVSCAEHTHIHHNGKVLSELTKQKISQSKKGSKWSDLQKQRHSQTIKAMWDRIHLERIHI